MKYNVTTNICLLMMDVVIINYVLGLFLKINFNPRWYNTNKKREMFSVVDVEAKYNEQRLTTHIRYDFWSYYWFH